MYDHNYLYKQKIATSTLFFRCQLKVKIHNMATWHTAASLRDCNLFEYHVDLLYDVARLVIFPPPLAISNHTGMGNGLGL